MPTMLAIAQSRPHANMVAASTLSISGPATNSDSQPPSSSVSDAALSPPAEMIWMSSRTRVTGR